MRYLKYVLAAMLVLVGAVPAYATTTAYGFSVPVSDVITNAGDTLSSLWPLYALLAGVAVAFLIFRKVRSVSRR